MREVGFCETCMRDNERCYGKMAEEIVTDSKKSKNLEKQKKYALETSNKLKKLRNEARIDECKKANYIDNNLDDTAGVFSYPGRELL
jgi:hypothetical protein